MRVRLKGIHRVRKRLATGQVQTYYYAWRGGPRLSGEPGSPEFVVSYQQAHQERRRPAEDTLKGILVEFQASSEFQHLRPKTRKDYARYLATIERAFGDMPLAALDDARARGESCCVTERCSMVFAGASGLSATPRRPPHASDPPVRGDASVADCDHCGLIRRTIRAFVTSPQFA